MTICEWDRQIVLGALDSLGVALADHEHEWTTGERAIYEEAVRIISSSPPSMDFGSEVICPGAV